MAVLAAVVAISDAEASPVTALPRVPPTDVPMAAPAAPPMTAPTAVPATVAVPCTAFLAPVIGLIPADELLKVAIISEPLEKIFLIRFLNKNNEANRIIWKIPTPI